MLRGDRVVLRPIEQGDLPRLWELLRDFEVSVLSSNGPVGPQSLAEFQTQHEERGAEAKRRAFYFAIDVNGELVGQCGLHAIAAATWGSRSAETSGGRASVKTP
jgi:RimJ/RimL family protein N-acetyltransferase